MRTVGEGVCWEYMWQLSTDLLPSGYLRSLRHTFLRAAKPLARCFSKAHTQVTERLSVDEVAVTNRFAHAIT